MPWSTPFDDPIDLPRGRKPVTLQDAGNYITKLPKAEHATAEWQTAMQCLIPVAENGGPTVMARIGVMRALYRHVVRQFNPGPPRSPSGKGQPPRDRRVRFNRADAPDA
jgi:hypothetical protein